MLCSQTQCLVEGTRRQTALLRVHTKLCRRRTKRGKPNSFVAGGRRLRSHQKSVDDGLLTMSSDCGTEETHRRKPATNHSRIKSSLDGRSWREVSKKGASDSKPKGVSRALYSFFFPTTSPLPSAQAGNAANCSRNHRTAESPFATPNESLSALLFACASMASCSSH